MDLRKTKGAYQSTHVIKNRFTKKKGRERKREVDSPAERDGDDSGTVLGDLEEHGHGEVEVRPRRVAPAAIVTWESKVGRTKVGGCDYDGRVARVAPPWVLVALDLKARTAAQAIVEKCCAQCRRVHSVALAVQISVPTSTT